MTTEKPKRIQRKRTKGWKMPPNTVYVGRPSKWGNPFNWRESKDIIATNGTEWVKGASVHLYREWLSDKGLGALQGGKHPTRDEIKKELRGKNLACWCDLDQPCHADILLRIANE